jgi:hypothetical protein
VARGKLWHGGVVHGSTLQLADTGGCMYLAKWLLPILMFFGVAIWTIATNVPRTEMDFISHGLAFCILGSFLVYFLKRDIWGLAD